MGVTARRLTLGRLTASAAVVAVLAPPLPSLLAEGRTRVRTPAATLTPVDGKDRLLELRFDSRVLGRETTSLVALPQNYRRNGQPTSTAYYLHDLTADGGAWAEFDGLRLSDAGQQFVVVAPDLGVTPWCGSCLWTDGANGLGVAADTYLQTELIPVVEQILNVRTDRSGRGVFGSGMGGTGALIEGLRHPDRFRFIGAVNGTLDLAGPDLPAVDEAALASQGVPPLATAEALHRNASPADLAEDALNEGLEVLVTADPGDRQRHAIADRVSAVWTEIGFAHTYVDTASTGAFRDYFVDRMNLTFSRPVVNPWRFSYKTTDRSLGLWGYDLKVDRPNDEFLHLLGARRDAHSLILAGTGTVQVTTPSVFTPGHTYRVDATPDPKSEDALVDPNVPVNPYQPRTSYARAGDDGRLRFAVGLAPTRLVPETEALVKAGEFPIEQTRVEVTDPDHREATTTDEPTGPLYRDPATLPAPFRDWDVRVEVAENDANPVPRSSQVLRLEFSSPSLAAMDAAKPHYTGSRGSVMVYIPDRYLHTDAALPVLYWLHGTGHGDQHFNLRLRELLGQMSFLVVVPDSGSAMNWCKDCAWVDPRKPHDVISNPDDTSYPLDAQVPGSGEGGGPGDTYIHRELIPLIQALFRVRTDRAGRAVAGNSMGALGALNQAFRHPDVFSFAGGLSGWLDHADYDTVNTPQWVTYYESHHYPLREQGSALYRDVSPLHTAPGALTANVDVVASVGDECVASGTWCARPDRFSVDEALARANHDRVAGRLTTLGLPWTHPRFHGMHYYADGDVFRAYYLPLLLRHFADPPPEPEVFSFKTTRQAFAIWGYDVTVQRANFDFEFLNLLGVRRDARDFTLAGTGTATVTTPAAFVPGSTYVVVITPDGKPAQHLQCQADEQGRLLLQDIQLGPSRMLPEHEAAVDAGLYPFPHTRFEVFG